LCSPLGAARAGRVFAVGRDGAQHHDGHNDTELAVVFDPRLVTRAAR
jgi:hypothetical protein